MKWLWNRWEIVGPKTGIVYRSFPFRWLAWWYARRMEKREFITFTYIVQRTK